MTSETYPEISSASSSEKPIPTEVLWEREIFSSPILVSLPQIRYFWKCDLKKFTIKNFVCIGATKISFKKYPRLDDVRISHRFQQTVLKEKGHKEHPRDLENIALKVSAFGEQNQE